MSSTSSQHRRPADARSRLIGILLVVSAVILWSTVPVGTKVLVGQGGAFSTAFMSAVRLWLAAAVFLLARLVYRRHHARASRAGVAHTGWLLLAALGIFGNYILYAIGLRYTTASETSVISQTHSVVTVLLAAIFLGERLTRQKIYGMLLATAGVVLVVTNGSSLQALFASPHLLGNLIQVVAALARPLYAIGQTKLLDEGQNQQVLLPIFLIAALLSLLALPFTGPVLLRTPGVIDWLTLAFLGIGSTAAAYWLFAAGVQRIETSEGAMFNVLIPPITLLLSWWLLGETLHRQMLVGLALVLGGLILLVWRRHEGVRRGLAKSPTS